MFRFFFIFFFFISSSYADNREKIIERLKNTYTLNFEFEQNINGKIENGNCIIKYPKKIFCKYKKNNSKILVSNGKSLVIKTKTSYYRYPLNKTALNFILDKKFMIEKIYSFKESMLDNKIINYKVFERENEVNMFFDNKSFDLLGWEIKDIYQNNSITYISNTRINEEINDHMFSLPIQN